MPPAPGAMDLSTLIASMSPQLQSGSFAFATVPQSDTSFHERLKNHPYEMLFREQEGWTLIAQISTINDLGLQAIFSCKKITLDVHSSLDAVGFLAAITTRLAEAKIGINPVSGFYHDHLFVPEGKEEQVVQMLKTMAEDAAATRAEET